jgi:betaine-aldehyde dehydrogenase
MRAASETVKPVMLELGGKNALIAYPDADVDEVAGAVIAGMNFTWCGQSCGSTSRAFVHEKIYELVLARVKEKIAYFKPGIPTDPATTMGAIVSKVQLERVMSYIESAKQEGARLLTGGGRPADPKLAKGFFIEPTVFADVQPTMRIAREEIFGPVLVLIPYEDEDDAVRIANDTIYGLAAGVWSGDEARAERVARRLRAGQVEVNGGRFDLRAPFGGFKQSGNGRENGRLGLEEYLEAKALLR